MMMSSTTLIDSEDTPLRRSATHQQARERRVERGADATGERHGVADSAGLDGASRIPRLDDHCIGVVSES